MDPGPAQLRLEVRSELDEVRDSWDRLAEASANLFSTWEWAAAWWRHYGDGREPLLALFGDAREPVALLPVYRAYRRPVRVLRLLGHGPADQLGPVCAPSATGVGAAIERGLTELGADVLLAERLAPDCPASASIGGARVVHESTPTIALDGLDWDGYLATRSSNFRSQVRRKERKLVREHGLSYRLCDSADRLPRDLDALFALHRARWGEEGSGALEGRREAFHRDFAARALERGWLRLWLAEVDGRAIAAWYGFRYGGADWYYQLGRDPDWERSSIGLVLLAHTIRDAAEAGQREYKLLRGAEAYKGRFATGDVGVDTVALARGALGHTAVAGLRMALAAPAPVRARVVRAGA